jgi:hypothetical protein
MPAVAPARGAMRFAFKTTLSALRFAFETGHFSEDPREGTKSRRRCNIGQEFSFKKFQPVRANGSSGLLRFAFLAPRFLPYPATSIVSAGGGTMNLIKGLLAAAAVAMGSAAHFVFMALVIFSLPLNVIALMHWYDMEYWKALVTASVLGFIPVIGQIGYVVLTAVGASQRWNALLRFDASISGAAAKLRPFGERWLDELGQAYFALNEDKRYLPNIVDRLTEEARRDKDDRWASAFKYTANGELCTEESFAILREAQAQGYTLEVDENKTFSATKVGGSTSFLRSNNEIQRFGRFAKILPVAANGHAYNGHDPGTCAEIQVSFREPLSFPKGTTLYKTTGPLVALLPDDSLIVDGGGLGGCIHESPSEYRERTGDRENWNPVRDF